MYAKQVYNRPLNLQDKTALLVCIPLLLTSFPPSSPPSKDGFKSSGGAITELQMYASCCDPLKALTSSPARTRMKIMQPVRGIPAGWECLVGGTAAPRRQPTSDV